MSCQAKRRLTFTQRCENPACRVIERIIRPNTCRRLRRSCATRTRRRPDKVPSTEPLLTPRSRSCAVLVATRRNSGLKSSYPTGEMKFRKLSRRDNSPRSTGNYSLRAGYPAKSRDRSSGSINYLYLRGRARCSRPTTALRGREEAREGWWEATGMGVKGT